MIKHVVLWKLKEFANQQSKEFNLKEMNEKLESLKGRIQGLHSLQVGLNRNKGTNASDICLITEHNTWDDLTLYQEHPYHREIASFIGTITESRSVVDFES